MYGRALCCSALAHSSSQSQRTSLNVGAPVSVVPLLYRDAMQQGHTVRYRCCLSNACGWGQEHLLQKGVRGPA
jgi:hypothetical protein